MTNKEAIEELRELIEIDLHPCPPIYEEALNLAIKALEQNETYKNAYRIMSDAFENEVRKNKRPHGNWIKDGEFYKCSECTSQELYPENFCYCCGADMRGGRE